ncbi:DUF2797 domain-containing protein [Haloarchaeobius sp. HRN-SO-5]|uniref:DUF2797 domain-containing protein n=1 Tax=Haloarchaeobius sp. HRN-SO-5 TaxID=3446118 RepID=UPI003EB8D458
MQVVGYETERPGRDAALVLASDGSVTRETLTPGADLSFSLGDRWCAGTVADGDHVACDREQTPYCDQHASTWVCARCTGTCLKPEMDCFEEHAVYLAAFAPDAFKVGVTKAWRLETRLREQGADRAAHVHTVSNGRIARELEAGYTDLVTDRVRVPTKIAGLADTVDERAWQGLLDEFDVIETFDFDYGLDLDVRPVAEPILTGTVVGTKGRILVVATGGTTYAVDVRDLVGYGVTRETSDRRVQSSLGSFS